MPRLSAPSARSASKRRHRWEATRSSALRARLPSNCWASPPPCTRRCRPRPSSEQGRMRSGGCGARRRRLTRATAFTRSRGSRYSTRLAATPWPGSPQHHGLDTAALEYYQGQYHDLQLQERVDVTEQQYMRMARGKYGALTGGALALGAVAAGADDATVLAFREAGIQMGVAALIASEERLFWGEGGETGRALNKSKLYPVVAALQHGTPPRSGARRLLFQARDGAGRPRGHPPGAGGRGRPPPDTHRAGPDETERHRSARRDRVDDTPARWLGRDRQRTHGRTMGMKRTLRDFDWQGKRALVRVDFNVPFERGTTRISATCAYAGPCRPSNTCAGEGASVVSARTRTGRRQRSPNSNSAPT